MIRNKDVQGWKHFSTWHSRFGLIAISLLVLQALVGAGSLWFGGKLFGGGDKATRVYKYHRISGYVLFTLLLVTVHLSGAWSDWSIAHTSAAQRALFYYIAPALIWIGVVWRIRFEKMKFWGET
ncbi:hypothetical protein FRC03_007400 [Tulasnella sp. 419]|nr:hypothetical protein FRC03_007400 [Tulasnella sp. 419]